jgi:hypothetical protein
MRNAYTILMGKPTDKRRLGGPSKYEVRVLSIEQ